MEADAVLETCFFKKKTPKIPDNDETTRNERALSAY